MSEAGAVRNAGKMDDAKDVVSPEPGTVRDAIADLAGKGEGGKGQSEAGTNGDAIAEPAGKVDGDRSTCRVDMEDDEYKLNAPQKNRMDDGEASP